MDNSYFLLIIIIFILFFYFQTKRENFSNIESTPEQKGLVFGYLNDSKDVKPSLNKNGIFTNDTISINTKNLYLGMNDKNPLLPNLLEKLGTFTPYEYDTITIMGKTDIIEPIFYNKTVICFSIKYLQEKYYLKYVPNTSTFYLSKSPSYFICLNSLDMNSKKQVNYNDSIIIKCLDNSEFLFEYESFLVTEADKSSVFYISRSETVDICSNFYKNKDIYKKQFINNMEYDRIINNSKKEINNFINTLKIKNNKTIEELKVKIGILEKKRANLIEKNSILNNKNNFNYKDKIKEEQSRIEKELKEYEKQLENEYGDFKKRLEETKKKYWTNEINNFKKEHCSKK